MGIHRFQPGNTFGKGRPKGSGYVQRCRKWAEKKGWEQLERIADGKRPLDDKAYKKAVKEEGGEENVVNYLPSEKECRAARKMLIEYGLGRPRQQLEVVDDEGKPALFGILATAAQLGAAAPKPGASPSEPRKKRS